jgi:hypothetical protein
MLRDFRLHLALAPLILSACNCETAIEALDAGNTVLDSGDSGDSGAPGDAGPMPEIDGGPIATAAMRILCPSGPDACNDENAPLIECVNLNFGAIAFDDPPCDLVVEIENTRRGNSRTEDLVIDELRLLVNNVASGTLYDGTDVGFSLIDAGAFPLIISIPDDQPRGFRRFKVRFAGSEPGTFFGSTTRSSGMQIVSNDRFQQPYATVSLSATGSAPDITAMPAELHFERPGMLSMLVQSTGDRDLVISSITWMNTTRREFTFSTDRGAPPITLTPNEDTRITVTYNQSSTTPITDALILESNDPNDSPTTIPITGGPGPRLRVTPTDTLPFATEPSSGEILLENIGGLPLTIQSLEITGPQGDNTHPSVDDFSITDCPAPCEPNAMLCAPADPNCTTSSMSVTIQYSNNDISSVDYAEFRIRSNDPVDDLHIVVLSGMSDPCLFPIAAIQVTPANPTVGTPVTLDASGSSPGSGAMAITNYQWSFASTPGTPPAFSSQGMVTTSFTPADAGFYLIQLTVTNDCGAESPSPATEGIQVQ